MDDHYQSVSGTTTLKSTASNWVSGKDFYINFIGRDTLCFSADYFDLRIWKNGIDGGNGTYCTSKVTKPTCTQGEYTTYTCSLCGDSYVDSYINAAGHVDVDYVCTACGTALSCRKNLHSQKGHPRLKVVGDVFCDLKVQKMSEVHKKISESYCNLTETVLQ